MLTVTINLKKCFHYPLLHNKSQQNLVVITTTTIDCSFGGPGFGEGCIHQSSFQIPHAVTVRSMLELLSSEGLTGAGGCLSQEATHMAGMFLLSRTLISLCGLLYIVNWYQGKMGGFPQSRQSKRARWKLQCFVWPTLKGHIPTFLLYSVVKSVSPDLVLAWSIQGGDLDIGFYKE